MKDWMKAKELLERENYTCVLCKEDKTYSSTQIGIAPMMIFLAQGEDLNGFSAADKIVGKAAALLFVKAGVKFVFAQVISQSAISIFEKFHIEHDQDIITEAIINRMGTGLCPMEQAVADIFEPEEAYVAIKVTIDKLKNGGI